MRNGSRDRAEDADRELAGKDKSAEQRDDQPVIGEELEVAEIDDEEEHHHDDDLVRERVEEFAQRGHGVSLARDVPVHKVRGAQNGKKHA